MGYASPHRMLQEMSSDEYARWKAYAAIEPLGETRGDYRAALIATTIANTVPRKKGQKSYQLQDFLLKYGPDMVKEQSWEDQLALAEVLNEAFGGNDLRPTKLVDAQGSPIL